MSHEKFDLVLLDLVMPVMSGFDVLKQLKDHGIRIPVVIVLTNLSQDINKKQCRELGAEDYIVKSSADAAEVWEKIKMYLPKYEAWRGGM